MHSLGENGEGNIRRHPANRGSHARWPLKRCVYTMRTSLLMTDDLGMKIVVIFLAESFNALYTDTELRELLVGCVAQW